MSNNLSRRNFLKLSSAALAASALSASRLSTFAQGAQGDSLTVALRSITIPTSAELLTSLTKFWGTKNKTEVKLGVLSRQQLTEGLVKAAQTGTGADVLESTYLQAYEHADMFVDVSDICEQVGKANGGWYDIASELCVVDGVWRAMPHFYAPLGMVYRTDLFTQAGISTLPKTWDEFLKAGTKLKAMGKPVGLTFGHALGDGVGFVMSLLMDFGGSITDENGKVNLDSAETKQAVEFAQQLFHDALSDSSLTYDDPDNNKEFLQGQISCTFNTASILWAALNDPKVQVDFADKIDHFATPAGPAGSYLTLEVHTLAIPKFSQNISKAKDFLVYLNSPDVWGALLPDAFAYEAPLLKDYDAQPDMPWNSNPKLTAFKSQAPLGKSISYKGKPSGKLSPMSTNFVITDMFARVCAGKATVEESIKQATQAVKDIYPA